jgi:signal transduction histidine kinase
MTARAHAGFAPLLTLDLRYEHAVVQARQRTRQIADIVGIERQDQVRFATAVSEIARNAFEYGGGGRVEFSVSYPEAREQMLVVRICDAGPGISNVGAILDGRFRSQTGLGLGIVGAKRLSDAFEITSSADGGTSVLLGKRLPGRAGPIDASMRDRIVAQLTAAAPESPLEELQHQNQQLLRAMAQLRERQIEVERLNLELEETNRGVLALYAELDEKTGNLERLNSTKTRFLSELSHELRTPLNAIRNVSRYLLGDFEGGLNDGQRKAIAMLDRSAESLTELVDDWLDLAKIEAGRITLRPTTFSIETMFAALRGMFRPIATSPAVLLVFETTSDLSPIESDEAKVSQILRNFISNALKYTERGEVRVTANTVGDKVELAVWDTGIGIAPADRERIFEEFSQVEHSLQTRVKGTGLGLPLSRKLARLLGGDVTARSEVGKGSTFALSIPRRLPRQLAELSDNAPLQVISDA